MKESPVHGTAIERTQRPTIGIRQNGFAAKLCGDSAEPRSNFIERFVPANAFECLSGVGAVARGRTLRPYSPHGIKHPVGRVHAVQILGYLGTQKSPSYRMRGITLDPRSSVILDGNQNAARVRTVMRTRSVDNLLHDAIIITSKKASG